MKEPRTRRVAARCLREEAEDDDPAQQVRHNSDWKKFGEESGPAATRTKKPMGTTMNDNSLVRHSFKRRFAALVLGPVSGCACSFELLQFVFDLHLWTDLGSKKSLQQGVPMRVMMKGSSISPLYWREVHRTLLDAVRQLGYPKLFLTIAPCEWSFPFHMAVRDEMAKMLRTRLHLPVLETLHMSHVMMQTVRGLMVGSTGDSRSQRSQEEAPRIRAFEISGWAQVVSHASVPWQWASSRPRLDLVRRCRCSTAEARSQGLRDDAFGGAGLGWPC